MLPLLLSRINRERERKQKLLERPLSFLRRSGRKIRLIAKTTIKVVCAIEFFVNLYIRSRNRLDLLPSACLVLRLCGPSGSENAAKNWPVVRSPPSTRTLPLFRRASTRKTCPTSSIGAPWRSAKRRGGG